MRFVTTTLLFIGFQGCLILYVAAQSKDFRVEVPSAYTSLIFLDDPGCPLKLGGTPRVIAYPNGAFSFGYAVTNVSNANVESFLVKEIDWFGNRSYDHPSIVTPGRTFSPGVVDYTLSDEEMANLDSFNLSLASKIGIISRPTRFWVVMVVNVRLSDGTTYDASHKFNQLSDFLNMPFSKVNMSATDLDQRESDLRSFLRASLYLNRSARKFAKGLESWLKVS